MRRFAILVFLSLSFCWAQESGNFQPSTTNVWAAEYPRVDSTGRVQIRVKVQDSCGGKSGYAYSMPPDPDPTTRCQRPSWQRCNALSS